MKFKLQNWLLRVIIVLTLIPPCLSAYISENSRQGSESVFPISYLEMSLEDQELHLVSRLLVTELASELTFGLNQDGNIKIIGVTNGMQAVLTIYLSKINSNRRSNA